MPKAGTVGSPSRLEASTIEKRVACRYIVLHSEQVSSQETRMKRHED
jgi:hypothetical protein